VECRTAPTPRCVSRGYWCGREPDCGFILRSHQNRKRAEVGFARETRRSNLRGIPSPKSERLTRTWIPTTSLVVFAARYLSFKGQGEPEPVGRTHSREARFTSVLEIDYRSGRSLTQLQISPRILRKESLRLTAGS